ncbi:TM2 domain-containing protein [Fluviispira multicolorata]|uniref:NINE protein n=1 Tax=Fluviispira multicolorata TaxID=2654512 RepID=A0A833N6A0_9BACT|nr:TM2 domain-containing protein [Fluviispira multicolorata]KAB8029808.1 NINE protein [Fluviispira multicolorata]
MDIYGKQANEKFCKDCGKNININAEICPFCGCRQMGILGITSGKSKVIAAIFALFLGGLGIHKFYLGKKGQGVLYILFCWTFIPAFIALIEGVLYLIMSDEKFNAKYNNKE